MEKYRPERSLNNNAKRDGMEVGSLSILCRLSATVDLRYGSLLRSCYPNLLGTLLPTGSKLPYLIRLGTLASVGS